MFNLINILSVIFLLSASGSLSAAELKLYADSDVVGEPQIIHAEYEDTFIKLARRYNLGYEERVQANPSVDPWLPGEGTKVVLPTHFVLPKVPRQGIVINLPELRLYYYPDGESGRVITHPISIGRMEWGTPLGRSEIVSKAHNPTWYPPESIREEHAAQNRPLPKVVPPGPDNPLGKHAMRLSLPGYLIHGTNKPSGLGMRVTHGCIRMFPEDIEALFENVPIGTPVRIVDQPYKIGWTNDGFYLEAHPPLEKVMTDDAWTMTALTRAFVLATEEGQGESFSWDLAEIVALKSLGVPEFVSSESLIIRDEN
ncbi:MAG: L,D-transpeptidase family protein [Gammaproteobacteria bacterium]|nr:L,D-transpeptidase family protein [Gammaproteobacteria bacterium]